MSKANEDKGEKNVVRIARQWLKDCLDDDMRKRTLAENRPVYAASCDDPDADLWAVDMQLDKARQDLRRRAFDAQGYVVDFLMREHSVPQAQHNALAHAILEIAVTYWEAVRKRTLGDFSGSPAYSEPHGQIEPTPQEEPTSGPLLSKLLPPYFDYMSQHEGWRGQTRAQNTATFKMFVEVAGDHPIQSYTRKDTTPFYDLLLQLPKDYAKAKQWRGLALAEIVARSQHEDCERLSMKTAKRHFSGLGRFFERARTRGEYKGENPAHGFEFPDKRRTRDKRLMWDDERLAKLFASPVWTGCLSESRRTAPGSIILKDEKYWLPLLGLYHGNRLEEFAQLRRADLRNEEGIWFVDINDDLGNQVKNQQSKRRVPLHPEVQRLGFLDYVQQIAPNPLDRLFPQLSPGGPDKKFGYYFTKWWSGYRRDVGVYEKALDYHSFRGGVSTQLASAGVSLEIRNELLGHEGTSTDERNYQKGFSLALLADAISRIRFDVIDWTRLK